MNQNLYKTRYLTSRRLLTIFRPYIVSGELLYPIYPNCNLIGTSVSIEIFNVAQKALFDIKNLFTLHEDDVVDLLELNFPLPEHQEEVNHLLELIYQHRREFIPVPTSSKALNWLLPQKVRINDGEKHYRSYECALPVSARLKDKVLSWCPPEVASAYEVFADCNSSVEDKEANRILAIPCPSNNPFLNDAVLRIDFAAPSISISTREIYDTKGGRDVVSRLAIVCNSMNSQYYNPIVNLGLYELSPMWQLDKFNPSTGVLTDILCELATESLIGSQAVYSENTDYYYTNNSLVRIAIEHESYLALSINITRDANSVAVFIGNTIRADLVINQDGSLCASHCDDDFIRLIDAYPDVVSKLVDTINQVS